jgi:hypothetical protein
LVSTKRGVKRVTEIDTELKMEIEEFLHLDFNKWIYAIL